MTIDHSRGNGHALWRADSQLGVVDKLARAKGIHPSQIKFRISFGTKEPTA